TYSIISASFFCSDLRGCRRELKNSLNSVKGRGSHRALRSQKSTLNLPHSCDLVECQTSILKLLSIVIFEHQFLGAQEINRWTRARAGDADLRNSWAAGDV